MSTNQSTQILWDRECLISDTNAPDAFDHKIKFFHSGMPVERVGAFGWKPPQPGPQNLALGSLKKIRIGDFHHIRWPPKEVFRFDEEIAVNWPHKIFLARTDNQQTDGRNEPNGAEYPSHPAKMFVAKVSHAGNRSQNPNAAR